MAMLVEPGATYTSSVRNFRHRNDEHGAYRLPPNHVTDLRDVARGIEESNVGICCRYLVDHMLSPGADIDEDGYINHLDSIERFYDMFPLVDPDQPELVTWRQRIKRCRRALAAMRYEGYHHEVSVLHVVYGYPSPFVREFTKKVSDELGELASLVRYTDVVEAKRQTMVREEAVRLSNRKVKVEPTKWRDGVPWEQKDACGDYVLLEQLEGSEGARRAINEGLPPETGAALVDFLRHKDYLAFADSVISSTDALRAQLAPTSDKAKDESDERYKERREAHEVRQTIFISQMKVEASKMLSDASKIFHAAWLASTS